MQQIGAIQSLRAIAALMVVIHHLAHELGKLPGAEAVAAGLRAAAPWMAGVDIFFVISGFIMVHASASLFGRPGAASLFLKRRLIRIVPLYWLMTIVVAAIAFAAPAMVTDGAPGLEAILASLLFWPHARPDGSVQPVLSLGWTLNYEMLFYALFAAALALGRGARATVLVTTGLLALLLAAGALAGALPWTFWGRPIVLEFALGMGVGLMRAAGWTLSGTMRVALLAGGAGALAAAPAVADQSGFLAVAAHGLPGLAMVAAAALGRAGDEDPFRAPALERLGGRLLRALSHAPAGAEGRRRRLQGDRAALGRLSAAGSGLRHRAGGVGLAGGGEAGDGTSAPASRLLTPISTGSRCPRRAGAARPRPSPT